MKRLLFLLCGCALWAPLPGRALDLTPRFVTRELNEGTLDVPYYTDGKARYSLELPVGVTAAAGSGETVFTFTKIDSGMMILKSSPLSPDQPFTELALKAYRQAVLATVPPGALNPSITGEQANPLAAKGWDSYRFTVAFQLPGRSFLQEVTFINFSPKQQLLTITAAPAKEFAVAQGLAGRIMATWRELQPGEKINVPPAF